MFTKKDLSAPLMEKEVEDDPFMWVRLIATVTAVSLGSSLQFGFATGSLNNLEQIVPATLAMSGNPINISMWAIINSCFSNKRGTDDLDVEEPILEGKEGATTRGTVFVDFGTGYRDSIGMSGLGLGGTDNPMARKSIGFKDIDLITNPIARGSIFDPLGGRNSVTLDSTPAMVTGKITIPKKKHQSKKVEDPVPIAEAPTDVPDVPGSSEFPALPRGPPPAGSPPSSSAIPSIGMPPRMPRGPPPPPGPPSKIGGPKKYTPPPRTPPH